MIIFNSGYYNIFDNSALYRFIKLCTKCVSTLITDQGRVNTHGQGLTKGFLQFCKI